MLTLLREISLRHFVRSPLRTFLVVLGIALGVAMLVGTLATSRSLVAAFEDMVDRVAGKADLIVAGGDSGVPSELVPSVAEVRGVAHAAAMLEITTREARQGGGPLLVLGVDFLGDTHFLPFEVSDGDTDVVDDPLSFINDPTAILVSRVLARERSLRVGSPLDLVTSEGPKRFRVRGILADKGPAASFGGQVAVMFLDAAQVSFARGTAVDRIDIALERGASARDVARRVARVVGRRGRVETPGGRGERLSASLTAFRSGLYLSSIVSLLVGMFLIYNAVAIAVAQRRREIGIVRALGVTRRRVVALFCVEAMLLAVIGIAFGLAIGQMIADMAIAQTTPTVSQFFAPVRPPRPRITLELAMLGAAAGMAATLFAAYWPARAAAKVDPAVTLRSTRATAMASRIPIGKALALGAVILLLALVPAELGTMRGGYVASVLITIGTAFLVPALVVVMRRVLLRPAERVLGVPGRLALDNVQRSLARSAITVVALMMAVGLSVTMGGWVRTFERSIMTWVENAVPADIIVTAGSPLVDRHNVAFAPDVVDRLRGIRGVEAMHPVRVSDQDLGDLRVQLLSLDSRVYLGHVRTRSSFRRILDGRSPIERTELYDSPQILLSENAAYRLGLHAGDRVRFRTPTGERSFLVRAVVVDYSSERGWALADRRWYVEYWGDTSIDAVDLYLAPGASPDPVVAEVRRRMRAAHGPGAQALFVTKSADLRREVRRVVLDTFSYSKSSEIVTLLIALMGVVGTMLAAVIDRTREVGILRAIGATRRQVTIAVVAEAGFLGLAAATAGVLSGIPQGLVFVNVIGFAATGWRLDYTFPAEIAARVGLLVVATAAAAGLFPGRRIASMDVTAALSYE